MVVKKVKKNSSKSAIAASKKYIRAAEDDFDEFEDDLENPNDLIDAISDVADNVEDLQDAVDDMDEDVVEIALHNNIANHFIAECNKCNGIFISAIVDSNQIIDHVSGTCPVCGKNSDQYLKWVIKAAD